MTGEPHRTGRWVSQAACPLVLPSPSPRTTYVLFRRAERRLLPQSCLLGLLLGLADQLLNEASWDDREQGRGRGRWGALVLLPNLFRRSKEGESSVSEPVGAGGPLKSLPQNLALGESRRGHT